MTPSRFHLAPLPEPGSARKARVAQQVRRAVATFSISQIQVQQCIKHAQERLTATGDDVDAVSAGIQHGLSIEAAVKTRNGNAQAFPVWFQVVRVMQWTLIGGLIAAALALISMLRGQL